MVKTVTVLIIFHMRLNRASLRYDDRTAKATKTATTL